MEENQSTNLTLIQRVKNQHDEASWEEFVNAYETYINRILNKLGVPLSQLEDLVQEILLSLWKSMETFEYNPRECKFRTWLFTVCKNKVFTFYRKDKNNKKNVELLEGSELSNEAEIDRVIEKEWQIYVAKKAFEKVKGQFKPHIVEIYLSFQGGENPQMIAKQHEVAENTVYVYNKRIKEALTREIILVSHELE